MGTYDDMWNDALNGGGFCSTGNITKMMNEVCQALRHASASKVCARFKLIRTLSGAYAAIAQLGENFARINDESDNLADANKLYTTKRYSFYIYNDTYRFRILETTVTPVYPIEVRIDEDIYLDEKARFDALGGSTEHKAHIQIASDTDMEQCVKIATESKKFRFILMNMMEQ